MNTVIIGGRRNGRTYAALVESEKLRIEQARELAEVKRERDQLRAMLEFADARINHGLERRAHPRTLTVTTIDGRTREVPTTAPRTSPC